MNKEEKDNILKDYTLKDEVLKGCIKQTLKHSLDIEFKKDYYTDEVSSDIKTMYHFSLKKDYQISDKADVLKAAIKDLEKELRLLELIDEGQDKARESWESISK